MKPSTSKKACLFVPLGLLLFLLLVISAFRLSNLNLPTHSTVLDRLSELEKARLAEAQHLRTELGDATWPGWSQVDIPLMVYNEKYAFLAGYPNPPAGWMKVPAMQPRGGPWEQVPGDLFEGQPYYRTLITDPKKTPEGFTVLVGERWVATFQTREYGRISFYQGFRKNLPPFISSIVPVRLVWALIMGRIEIQISALEHEAFHAYQGMLAQSRLTDAESMYDVEAGYPYDQMEKAWYQEMNLLVQAVQADSDAEAAHLARQFLQLRDSRRASLNAAQVKLERLREWEEGLAKFAELDLLHRAASDQAYRPVEGLSQDKEFHGYREELKYWAGQLKEAKNPMISGDTRFYYSGNALAILLDRLSPGWKTRALPGGDYLDILLQEAVD